MKQHVGDHVFRYGIAVVAVGIVIFVWNFFPALSSRFPFLFATVPVLLAAWYGGVGPGIVASVLSAIAVYYFFMDPRHVYGANPTDIAAVIIYLLIAVFVSYLTTARRKAEMAASDAEGRLRFALNAGNMGAWDWNLLTNELKWIGDLERMHGLRPGEFGGTMEAFVNLIYPEDRPKVNEDIQVALQSFGQFSTEFRVQWPDGSIHWVAGRGKALPGRDGKPARMIGIGLDLTESKRAQEVLFLQLRENKVLLKEMNHRVKNNLQVISSLLRLQSRYAEPSAREFLLESQNRIQTMALIHEKLYGSENLTRINLQSYLKDLTEGMFDSYAVNRNKISLELKCEGEYLDLDKAIPCGLLINEILTNSLKHAFPEDRSGHIWVRFRGDNGRFHLELGDDGIGIAEGLDVKQGKTLGLRLIRSLVTQLHGNLNLESSRGTKFTIDFK